jgi:hypothetical protein
LSGPSHIAAQQEEEEESADDGGHFKWFGDD